MNEPFEPPNPPTAEPPPPPGPPPFAAPQAGPTRRLRRRSNGSIGGVAGGLADYLDIDATIVKVAFVVLAIAGGFGLFAYFAAWILLPDDTDPDPRPVVVRSSVPAIVGASIMALFSLTLILDGISVGSDTSLVVAAIFIGAGILLLDQRSREASAAGAGPSAFTPPAFTPTDGRRWSPSPSAYAGGTPTEPDRPTTPIPPSLPPSVPPPYLPSDESYPGHWALPRTSTPPEPPAPKAPVTSVTLAAAAVLVGLLLVIGQVTSVEVNAAAVFGAVLLACGLGLMASAFVGRALPLIPVAFLAIVGLGISPVVDAAIDGGFGEREFVETLQINVDDSYEVGAGYISLDLRDVDFTTDDEVTVDVGAGYAEIIVPEGLTLNVKADTMAGMVRVIDDERSGFDTHFSGLVPGTADSPVLTIDAEVTFGYIEVRRG